MTEAQRRPLMEGSIYEVAHGQKVQVLEYVNKSKVRVRILGDIEAEVWISKKQIINKTFRSPLIPFSHNVGYIGVGTFSSRVNSTETVEYKRWADMISRCYDPYKLLKHPSYIDVTVSSEWHNFQNFAEWYTSRSQYKFGWQIDKDLLSAEGHKIYSKDTCTLLPAEINGAMIVERVNKTGDMPVGVRISGNRYTAQLKAGTPCQVGLGTFDTPEEAFAVYKSAKESYVRSLADKYKELLDRHAYESLKDWTI